MRNEVLIKDEYKTVRGMCGLQDELCAYWASIGECEVNPSYMQVSYSIWQDLRICRKRSVFGFLVFTSNLIHIEN